MMMTSFSAPVLESKMMLGDGFLMLDDFLTALPSSRFLTQVLIPILILYHCNTLLYIPCLRQTYWSAALDVDPAAAALFHLEKPKLMSMSSCCCQLMALNFCLHPAKSMELN